LLNAKLPRNRGLDYGIVLYCIVVEHDWDQKEILWESTLRPKWDKCSLMVTYPTFDYVACVEITMDRWMSIEFQISQNPNYPLFDIVFAQILCLIIKITLNLIVL